MRLAVMLWTLAVLFAGSPPARLEATPWPAASVELGDEVFLRETWHELHGRCIGIVTNQTGVTSQLESLVDAVRRNPAICLKAIYAPEHGFRGDRPAGAYVPFYTDERTGLPVYSLYGASRHPTAAMLAGVDVLLFDIQDVGDRTYTYISTLAYVMQAAQAQKKEVWVLDRPNPMGGETIEGPVLEPHLSSFIGLYPLPVRHGMTVGELAQMYRGRFGIDCALRVIAMRGWKRSMLWSETGLAWVQTSPNIPEWDTTLVYPATGLIESAGVNNGTGYTKPFKYAGAPGLDGAALAQRPQVLFHRGEVVRPRVQRAEAYGPALQPVEPVVVVQRDRSYSRTAENVVDAPAQRRLAGARIAADGDHDRSVGHGGTALPFTTRPGALSSGRPIPLPLRRRFALFAQLAGLRRRWYGMRAKIMSADALPLLTRHFGFLVEEYGFVLGRTRVVPAGAWYASASGTVAVSFDYLRDAAVDVSLQESPLGEAYLLSELTGTGSGVAPRRTGVREPGSFELELAAAAETLKATCADFLRGDVAAFRARHREAMLVARCRRLALQELRRHAPERAAELLSAMRGYWTAADRETFERCEGR